MDLTIPDVATAELAAAFFQAAVSILLAGLCTYLYRRFEKRYFLWWSVAWGLYAVRLAVIVAFFFTNERIWLFWHQVVTGVVALTLLWAALVFSRQMRWRWSYAGLALFPLVWSYVAIYQLDDFLLAAGPAVLFLSGATVWTAGEFLRYGRKVGSTAATLLSVALFLWAVHHLDYPFLRARGIWTPWGYYLDVMFELFMGVGILLLVVEDLYRGLSTSTALSADLQRPGSGDELLDALLQRHLSLPAVTGSAVYLSLDGGLELVRGVGVCTGWTPDRLDPELRSAVGVASTSGVPREIRQMPARDGSGPRAYAAVLPILSTGELTGAVLVVGEARNPFAALDTPFLVSLGYQVGAALEKADLYRRLERRTEDLEQLAARMVRQIEDERRRISRELHDETAQVFAAVRMELGLLRESSDPPTAERLGRALDLVGEGIRSIRTVTSHLRPTVLDDLGLMPAMRALIRDFQDGSGIEVGFTAEGRLPPLSDEGELALFRSLQEALNNVAQHADATRVDVRLGVADGAAVLEVRDDGRGLRRTSIPGTPFRHLGLTGMRERVVRLGGDLDVRDHPERGVLLTARVPADGGACE